MNSITGTLRKAATLEAAIALVMSLAFMGSAWALFPPDGTKPNGPGAYRNPDDGICVIGVNPAGSMLVDWSITNARDCVAWTRSANGATNLVGMATQAQCLTANGVAPNDGYRHSWSTSLCYDTVNNRGLSRVDLDNTDAMCLSKGGTVVTSGKCVAYGWVYLNRKADGTLPVTGTGVSATPGVQLSDGLGFCSASMRMTGTVANNGTFTSTSTCPSVHNSNTLRPLEWPACLSSLSGCQTQASYDAGLGWSSSGSGASYQCVYAYGSNGITSAATTAKADGIQIPTGTLVDLRTYDQGDCLANGFSWDNWLPNTSAPLVDKTTPGVGELVGLPDGAVIRRLDALSSIEDGGGDFYSGTGAVCQKCHSDQSRSYQERDKPGFPETRHKLAGDAVGKPFQPHFTAGSSEWGLTGVQCAMCHSTAKPPKDDLIQVQPTGYSSDPTPNASCTASGAPYACCTGAGTGTCDVNRLCTAGGAPYTCCTGSQAGTCAPITEGAPKSASGHNQTEYGTHLIDICYTCHATAATPIATNPASVIPSTTTDFVNTGKGLPPIANQFLNSPHAKYTGSSSKIDVGNKNFYTSTFEGYVCRTAATQFRNNATPGDTQGNCEAAGHTWYTAVGIPAPFCYYNETSCEALSTGQWLTTFSSTVYPWAAATNGPGGLCVGVGIGSIITTVYRNGTAERIHNLDSTTNEACTNAPDGTAASGAGGFWVKDGETSPGTPTDTAQGNCMTCHDVHWALASEVPHAEPLRRECTSCHVNPVASASLAPQIDPARINHLAGAGSPLANLATDPDESCEFCHMPKSSATGSPMHLFRINTSSTYTTMGAAKANSAADGAYATASWVDIDHACGQCHYTNGVIRTSTVPAPNWPIFTKGQMALRAKGIHQIVTPPPNPTPVATQTCGFAVPSDANIWKITVTDTSPNQTYIAREAVNWADGSVVADDRVSPFGPFEHTYIGPGTYTILHTVIDTQGQIAASTCQATLTYFTIGGTVTTADLTTQNSLCTGAGAPSACCTGAGAGSCDTDTMLLSGANVTATSLASGQTAATAVTGTSGTYTLGSLKPGSYSVGFFRVGYSFPAPTTWVVGPSQTGADAIATLDLGRVRVVMPKNPPKNPGKLTAGPGVK